MREYQHVTGHLGRRFHADEIIKVQTEYLDVLQGLFSAPGEAAAIYGVEVTGTAISAGLAIIQHSTDGWKVVRVTAATGVTFPYYLQVTKNTFNKLYGDSSFQRSYNEYVAAVATPSGTPSTALYLKITADGAVRWEEAEARKASSAWEVLSMTGTSTAISGSSGNLRIRKDRLTNTAHLQGYTDITDIGMGIQEAYWENIMSAVAAKYRPAIDCYFTAMLQYDETAGTYYNAFNGNDKITVLSGCLTAAGDLNLGMIRRQTLGTAQYRVHINAVIPLG